MKIDPHAWVLTFPVTIAAIQLYFQPETNLLKRWWRQARQAEAAVWERLGFNHNIRGLAGGRWARSLFTALVAALAIASAFSLAAFLGWVPSSH